MIWKFGCFDEDTWVLVGLHAGRRPPVVDAAIGGVGEKRANRGTAEGRADDVAVGLFFRVEAELVVRGVAGDAPDGGADPEHRDQGADVRRDGFDRVVVRGVGRRVDVGLDQAAGDEGQVCDHAVWGDEVVDGDAGEEVVAIGAVGGDRDVDVANLGV